MGGQDDFVNSLRAIMAAKREELGEPPAPDELLAYRDGRLDPAARERLEARIAVYPEAARALADLAAFPEIEPAPGVLDVSPEEVGARWQTFRQKLAQLPESRPPVPPVQELPDGPPAPVATAPVLRHEPRASRAPRESRDHPARRLAAAASVALAVGLGSGFLAGRASLGPGSDSSINVEITELNPVEEGGERAPGSSAAVELPEGSEELVLVLNLDDPGEFPGYEAEIVDAEGARVWSRDGLRPTAVATFHLSFRRSVLDPGVYRIDLFGRDGAERRPVARYELRIEEGQ